MQGGTNITGKKKTLWMSFQAIALYSAVLTVSSCQLAFRKDIHASISVFINTITNVQTSNTVRAQQKPVMDFFMRFYMLLSSRAK